MLTWPHVEDYLEFLGGYDVNVKNSGILLGPTDAHRFRLARYDIKVVETMAANTVFGTALTDKQAELAVKLILKYRRQFSKMGIDVSPVENPQYRLPLRKIDRSKLIELTDHIEIKFPYDTDRIQDLRDMQEQGQGYCKFNRLDKTWHLGLTEANVYYVVPWARDHGFEVSDDLVKLYDKIKTCKRKQYSIKLVKGADGYTIDNAPTSLTEYIEKHIGFNLESKDKLVDYAGICEYTVDSKILKTCSKALAQFGPIYNTYIPEPTQESLDLIFDYAEETNRYPICIFNPTMFDIDLSRFDEQDIVRFDRNGKTATSEYNPYDVKIVYAHKIPQTWTFPVPLLITTFEMMFGGKRMWWTKNAEKIIYYGLTKTTNG